MSIKPEWGFCGGSYLDVVVQLECLLCDIHGGEVPLKEGSPTVGYGQSKRPIDLAALCMRASIDLGDDESPRKLYISKPCVSPLRTTSTDA